MITLLWVASFKIKKILRTKIYRRSILIFILILFTLIVG